MRRIVQLSIACLAAGAVSACKSPDEIIKTQSIPTAGVRFINAVPDTAGSYGLDFRFVDITESNAQYRIPFRNNPSTSGGVTASTLVQYKNAQAGQRHFRIFLSDSLAAVASHGPQGLDADARGGEELHRRALGQRARGRHSGDASSRSSRSPSPIPGAQVALRVMNTTGARSTCASTSRPARRRPRQRGRRCLDSASRRTSWRLRVSSSITFSRPAAARAFSPTRSRSWAFRPRSTSMRSRARRSPARRSRSSSSRAPRREAKHRRPRRSRFPPAHSCGIAVRRFAPGQ